MAIVVSFQEINFLPRFTNNLEKGLLYGEKTSQEMARFLMAMTSLVFTN